MESRMQTRTIRKKEPMKLFTWKKSTLKSGAKASVLFQIYGTPDRNQQTNFPFEEFFYSTNYPGGGRCVRTTLSTTVPSGKWTGRRSVTGYLWLWGRGACSGRSRGEGSRSRGMQFGEIALAMQNDLPSRRSPAPQPPTRRPQNADGEKEGRRGIRGSRQQLQNPKSQPALLLVLSLAKRKSKGDYETAQYNCTKRERFFCFCFCFWHSKLVASMFGHFIYCSINQNESVICDKTDSIQRYIISILPSK